MLVLYLSQGWPAHRVGHLDKPENMPRYKHYSLFDPPSVTKEKQFYKINLGTNIIIQIFVGFSDSGKTSIS